MTIIHQNARTCSNLFQLGAAGKEKTTHSVRSCLFKLNSCQVHFFFRGCAPHRTIPHQVKYSTAEILPTNFVPDPSINLMWYFVFEVGRVGRVCEIVAYMYQWDRIPYDTYCVEYDKV